MGFIGAILGRVPVLVGVSRKSMVGAITGRPVGERLPGSLAAMLAAAPDPNAVHALRDPTRGGLVAATVEIARAAGTGWRSARDLLAAVQHG